MRKARRARKAVIQSTISLKFKLAESKDLSAFFLLLYFQAQGRHTVGTSHRHAYILNSEKYTSDELLPNPFRHQELLVMRECMKYIPQKGNGTCARF